MSTPDAAGLADPGTSDRTRVRRLPERAVTDRAAAHAVLDAALIAHVGIVDGDQPFVVPVACARRGEDVLFHGSTGSRLFRALAAGAATCLTVTHLDGLVLARSAFESSMNYRSLMVLGRCRVLAGDDKADALRVLTEHLLPGQWDHVRHPSAKEDAATMVLALSLAECSLKIRTGPAEDLPEDLDRGIWAGVVPLSTTVGEPEPAPDLAPGIGVPDHITAWRS